MTTYSFARMRRVAAWVALAVTMIAMPGSPAAACCCMPRAATAAHGTHCVHCGPRLAPADGSAQLERSTCCGMRTVQQAPALVTAPVELDRTPSSTPATALAVTVDLGCLATTAGTGRAPPSGFAANAPPALYLESFLRL